MARDFCLLEIGCNSTDAADCSKHRHISKRELAEHERTDSIEFVNLHPARKVAQYAFKKPARTWDVAILDLKKMQRLSRAVIERAVGTHGAGPERWAQKKVREYAESERRPANTTAPAWRATLERIRYATDLIVCYPSDAVSIREEDLSNSKAIAIKFHPRTDTAIRDALDFRAWLRRPVAMVDFSKCAGVEAAHVLALELAKASARGESLSAPPVSSNALWKKIVKHVETGHFTGWFNDLRGDQIGINVFDIVLAAFLGVKLTPLAAIPAPPPGWKPRAFRVHKSALKKFL